MLPASQDVVAMLVVETEETIARFIGLFSVEEFDPKLRGKVYGGSPDEEAVNPHRLPEESATSPVSGSPTSAHNPHLRHGNDRFEIEDAAGARLKASPIEATLDPLHIGTHRYASPGDVSASDPLVDLLGGHHARAIAVETQAETVQDAAIAYHDIPSDSLFAVYAQTTILDDRDTLVLDPDLKPLEAVEAVARQFGHMLELAKAADALPSIPHDAAGFQVLLATSAYEHRGDGTPAGDGPTGHEGLYVNGRPASEMPDLPALLDALKLVPGGDGASSLDTGSNLLSNEAGILNIADLGAVSVVKGDWHETNSIRQINIYADADIVSGLSGSAFTSEATQSFNIARFERIDATPGSHPAAATMPPFPTSYQVDIVHGDLQITNFLSQVNFSLDGDRVVLSALKVDATIGTGGNEVANAADILKTLGQYDLVIISGSVFEGNFIQQINVLSDRDRIVSEGGDGSGPQGSFHAGGNLLVNNASITNYGAISDFSALSPHMRDLVANVEAHAATGTGDLGADLAFLNAQHVRALYIDGNVYELNVISQLNVLDDSDTVLAADGAVARFVDSFGPTTAWTVSTGHNGLVNNAAIIDVDDASSHRFIGGEYYSDSMLLQAGLVDPDEGVTTYDVNHLAPELVAFVSDIQSDGPSDDDAPAHHTQHLHADGVAGILA